LQAAAKENIEFQQDYDKGFKVVNYPQPHKERSQDIVKAHPEIKKLFGPTPTTAFWILGLVITQMILAPLLSTAPWYVLLLVAYVVGATINHALFVLVHECTHNLVFEKQRENILISFIANFPLFLPSSHSFRKYHILHHRHLGEFELDADLAGPREIKFFGHSPIMKMLWLFFFGFIQGFIRPARTKHVTTMDRWIVINALIQVTFVTLTYLAFGWGALWYYFVSIVFALGLHPLGARWVQEHYTIKEDQETYSYYGPLNYVCFNMGYHNEHHDLIRVPWSKLPKLKNMAPEFYDNLYSYKSWTWLLYTFIFDSSFSVYSRITRPTKVDPDVAGRDFRL